MTTMLKLVVLVRRREDVSHDELVARWQDAHMPAVIKNVQPDQYRVTFFDADHQCFKLRSQSSGEYATREGQLEVVDYGRLRLVGDRHVRHARCVCRSVDNAYSRFMKGSLLIKPLNDSRCMWVVTKRVMFG